MIAQTCKLSACFALAFSFATPAFAARDVQVAELAGNVAGVQSAASAPIQTDIATHAPQRLSKLSGSDDAAWADAHSLHAVAWHRPLVPLHVSLTQPAKPEKAAAKSAPANKVAIAAGKVASR